jgi:hypothetical protein
LEAVEIDVLGAAYDSAVDIRDLEAKLSRKEASPHKAARERRPLFTLPDRLAKDMAKVSAWQTEKETAPIATRDAVWKLTDATEELIESTERSSRLLIRLTMALVALTIAVVGLTALLVVLAL